MRKIFTEDSLGLLHLNLKLSRAAFLESMRKYILSFI